MIKPYHQANNCTIYCGDCREIMPELFKESEYDLLITDPPYGMDYESKSRIVRYGDIAGDKAFDAEWLHWMINLADYASYVFMRWDNFAELKAPPKSLLAWVKNNHSMGDLAHEHGRKWEAIAFYPGILHCFNKRIPDVIEEPPTSNELHPTQKPVNLLKKIIACNRGNLIVDPYLGSGTTMEAARDLGRECIGIEIEEKYCETAARRIEQDILPFPVEA